MVGKKDHKKKDCGKCLIFEEKCIERYEKLIVKQQETLIKNLIININNMYLPTFWKLTYEYRMHAIRSVLGWGLPAVFMGIY